MPFKVQAKTKSAKEIARAFGFAPKTFFAVLRAWLLDERAASLGGWDSKGRNRKGGFRRILSRKKLKKGHTNRGDSTWASQVAGLFKGYVKGGKRLDGMALHMGVGLGGTTNQMQRAIIFLKHGGTITSSKGMMVPHYRNLAKINFHGPWFGGNAKSGLTSKAFRSVSSRIPMAVMRKGNETYYFDARSKKKRGNGFKRSGLLFSKINSIRVSAQLTGRYDYEARFNRSKPAIIRRGKTAVERATKQVQRKAQKGNISF